LFILLVCCGMMLPGEDVKIIKNPVPNCVESHFTELVKCGEVMDNGDSEEFMVRPMSLVADERGHVFAYDAFHAVIFQYDSDLRFVRIFGRRGQGPGEIGLEKRTPVEICIRGKEIYVPDAINSKILCFNTDGQLVREISMNTRRAFFYALAVDRSGRIYFRGDRESGNRHVVDCYNGHGEYVRGFLEKENLLAGLFFKAEIKSEFQKRIPERFRVSWYLPGPGSNSSFAVTDSDRLLIYSSTSGYFWVFRKGKLYKSGRLWPRDALEDYRIRLEDCIEKGGFFPFFSQLFLDEDDPECFFLYYGYFRKGSRMYLYQFDLSGELRRVYFIHDPQRRFTWIRFKRHQKFYAVTRNAEEDLTVTVFQKKG